MRAIREQTGIPDKTIQNTAALWAGLSFALPAAAVFVMLAVCGITPFGGATLVTEQGFRWFENFCRAYEGMISGEGIFYHLNEGFGGGFTEPDHLIRADSLDQSVFHTVHDIILCYSAEYQYGCRDSGPAKLDPLADRSHSQHVRSTMVSGDALWHFQMIR